MMGEWISVKDRLPVPHTDCLAFFRDGAHVAKLSMSGPHTWYIPDRKEWDTGATHWMPLPEAPKVTP